MNEKGQVTQEISYSEERKRRRASGITKEVTRQQKNGKTKATENNNKQF
jgi:hypothetical protein